MRYKMRMAKKGLIYILRGNSDIGDVMFKYGCTSKIDIRPRVYFANKKANKIFSGKWSFKPIYLIFSKDIYKDECRIKWMLWSHHYADHNEFFPEEIFIKIQATISTDERCLTVG